MENQEDQILLEVRDLTTCFEGRAGTVHAVNGVSFQVKKGEILGLVGESGCGKSATCRSVISLLPGGGSVTGGQIRYLGTELAGREERFMRSIRGREIGMIFQEPMNTLNPVTTIGEQLIETMQNETMTKTVKKEQAQELLKMVGIPSPKERLSEYAHQFSGGMRQRAMIAIALAAGPKLLIADEPTTALDVTVQQQIIRLLLQLRDNLGMGMIFVTHDLGGGIGALRQDCRDVRRKNCRGSTGGRAVSQSTASLYRRLDEIHPGRRKEGRTADTHSGKSAGSSKESGRLRLCFALPVPEGRMRADISGMSGGWERTCVFLPSDRKSRGEGRGDWS